MSWMPIETAPKDGRVFLAAGGKFHITIHGQWALVGNCFKFYAIPDLHGDCIGAKQTDHPTHWQPLPEPPAS